MALSVDASTPALVSGTDPWTTASFTPPSNSLLVAVVIGDWFGGTPTITVTSTGLTFTRQARQGASNQGLVEVWTAEVGASGGSSRTVTADTSIAANTGGLKVYVVTSDAESTYYVDATAGATGVTTNAFDGSITTNSDGAWVFGGGSEWNNLGTPTSSDTGEAGTPGGVAVLAVRKGSATATAGAETLNFDASGTSAAMWSWAAVAIQEGASPWPQLVEAGALSAAAAGTSITPAIPASAQADDVMLMAAMCNGSTTFTTPTGWTLLGTSVESNANQSTEWYWKRHDGSEADPTSTTSATLSSTIGGYGRIYVFRGCLTSGDPFEDVTMAGTPTNGANPTSAAIDTTDTNRLAVSLLSVDDDNTWSSGNPPSGWNAIGRVASTTGGDCMMDGLTRAIPTAGAVAQVTIGGMSAADYWRSLTLALIPEPPAAGGDVTGSGAVTAGAATGSGSGTVSLTGSGSGTVAAATGSGSGTILLTGSGAGTAAAATGSGAGALSVTGSGAVTAPAATGSGAGSVGSEAISGSGAATAPAATASGAGTLTLTGSGAATAPAATGSGSGSVGSLITGSGSATAPAATGSGAGTLSLTGAATGTAAAPTGSGTGALTVTGSATVAAAAATATADGTIFDPSAHTPIPWPPADAHITSRNAVARAANTSAAGDVTADNAVARSTSSTAQGDTTTINARAEYT